MGEADLTLIVSLEAISIRTQLHGDGLTPVVETLSIPNAAQAPTNNNFYKRHRIENGCYSVCRPIITSIRGIESRMSLIVVGLI